MEPPSECVVQLRVNKADNVPKVETVSDPYVLLRIPGLEPQRTRTIQDCSNPEWGETFFFECSYADEKLQAIVEIEVWDEDTTTDNMIGKTTLDLTLFDSDSWSDIALPIAVVDKYRKKLEAQAKKNKQPGSTFPVPILHLSIVGTLPTRAALQEMLQLAPGVVSSSKERAILVPIAGTSLMVGVQYPDSNPREGPNLLVVSSKPMHGESRIELDIPTPFMEDLPMKPAPPAAQPTPPPTKASGSKGSAAAAAKTTTMASEPGAEGISIHRMRKPSGKRWAPGVRAYEQLTVKGLPLSIAWDQITLSCTAKLPPSSSYSVWGMLENAGWPGPGVSYREASSAMRSYGADHSSKQLEVYMPLDHEQPPQCVLSLDFRETIHVAAGPCPSLVAYPSRDSALCWEFVGEAEAALEVREDLYLTKSRKVMHGENRIRVQKRVMLQDGDVWGTEDLAGLQLVGYDLDYQDHSTWPFYEALLGSYAWEDSSANKKKNKKDKTGGGEAGTEAGAKKLWGKLKAAVMFKPKAKEDKEPARKLRRPWTTMPDRGAVPAASSGEQSGSGVMTRLRDVLKKLRASDPGESEAQKHPAERQKVKRPGRMSEATGTSPPVLSKSKSWRDSIVAARAGDVRSSTGSNSTATPRLRPGGKVPSKAKGSVGYRNDAVDEEEEEGDVGYRLPSSRSAPSGRDGQGGGVGKLGTQRSASVQQAGQATAGRAASSRRKVQYSDEDEDF